MNFESAEVIIDPRQIQVECCDCFVHASRQFHQILYERFDLQESHLFWFLWVPGKLIFLGANLVFIIKELEGRITFLLHQFF